MRLALQVGALVGCAALGGCVRPARSTQPHDPAVVADQEAESGGRRRSFARCLPPDRSFAVGARPADLASLSRVGGSPALVVANEGSNDLSLVRREGDRWREVQRVSTGSAPFALAVSDIDADGSLDVTAIHREAPLASLHFGAADGTLGSARPARSAARRRGPIDARLRRRW